MKQPELISMDEFSNVLVRGDAVGKVMARHKGGFIFTPVNPDQPEIKDATIDGLVVKVCEAYVKQMRHIKTETNNRRKQ